MPIEPQICQQKNCYLPALPGKPICQNCLDVHTVLGQPKPAMPMSQKYPKYYKSVKGLDEIDVYTVHQLFNIQDPSGCIQHASKKLLLSGVRTGGKSVIEDITEARDTLTRYLQLHGAAKQ